MPMHSSYFFGHLQFSCYVAESAPQCAPVNNTLTGGLLILQSELTNRACAEVNPRSVQRKVEQARRVEEDKPFAEMKCELAHLLRSPFVGLQ